MVQSSGFRGYVSLLLFLAFGSALPADPPDPPQQQWGDLKMQYVLPGPLPMPQPIRPAANVPLAPGQALVDQSVIVDPETRGIKNVLVYLYTGAPWYQKPAATHAELKRDPRTVTLETRGGQFDPRIVTLSPGDTLKVFNPGPAGHRVAYHGFNNPARVSDVAPGTHRLLTLDKSELAPVPVECKIHPWMKGYVVVFDTPYIATSDEEGFVKIKNLPAGQVLHFRLFHERAGRLEGLQKAEGGVLLLRRNVFSQRIEPGMNDLGTILLPL